MSINSFCYPKSEFLKEFPFVSENEIEKSDEQISLIRLADDLVREFAQSITGYDYAPIPLGNFYVVPDDVYLCFKEGSPDNIGICYPYYRSIVIHEDGMQSALRFVAVVTHELLHAYASVFDRSHYRVGLQVADTFEGLTEGVICYIEMILRPHLMKSSLLSEERYRFERMFDDLSEDEKLEDISFFDDAGAPVFFGYNDLAEFLKQVSLEIQDALGIKRLKDILHVFFKAHFTGCLLPLARIVEKVFGKGAFRILGNMDKDEDWGFETLTALKEMQSRQ